MKSRKVTAHLRIRVALMVALALFVLVFVLFDQLVTFAPGGRRKENPPVQVDNAIGATLEPLDRGTARTLDVGPEAGGLVVTTFLPAEPLEAESARRCRRKHRSDPRFVSRGSQS